MLFAHQHNKAHQKFFSDVCKELSVRADVNFRELGLWEPGERTERLEEGEVFCGGILRWTRDGRR